MRGMKYGYARTSTDDQKSNIQTTALRKAGCLKVFEDRGYPAAPGTGPRLPVA
jgi:DNA invertase Pin-like site-specific DNA recombinase